MLTESEARKTWCPNVCATNYNRWFVLDDDHNLTDQPHPDCCCIASRCMMWEWDKYVMFFPETNSLQTASAIDFKAVGAPKGDCGLKRGQP